MDDLPAAKTPYQHMLDLMPEATEAQRRARLGGFGFGADKADTKAENLSGGEKARLLFALATFGGRHLLILDEPTNHLDVDAARRWCARSTTTRARSSSSATTGI